MELIALELLSARMTPLGERGECWTGKGVQEAERMQIRLTAVTVVVLRSSAALQLARYEEKRKGVLRAVEQSERIVDTLTPEDREAYNFAKATSEAPPDVIAVAPDTRVQAFLVSSSISP
eukprot:722300-Amphidinium_carterae.1